MKTFLSDIILIEKYLQDALPVEKRLLVEAKLITDNEFKRNVFLQRKIYQLIGLFKNKQLRTEAEKFHERLFNDPAHSSYSSSIFNLFKN